MCTDCNEINQGPAGYNGWSPIYQTVTDNVNLDTDGNPREVLQLIGWEGGTGIVPTMYINQYLTSTGYDFDISLATNIKGPQGDAGAIGPSGNVGTDLSGNGVPSGGTCVTLGTTYTDLLTGNIYTCDGAGTWTLTSTSIVNPTNVLALDISTIAKKCASPYIGGDTLEEYLAGMIDYMCAIGGGGSSPTYDTQVTFYAENNVTNGSFGGDLILDAPATVLFHFNLLFPVPTEGVQKFTVTGSTTVVQFELWSGGGANNNGGSINEYTNSAFIIKSDGSNYYYVFQADSGSVTTVFTNASGTTNCPINTIGNAGGVTSTGGSALGGNGAGGGYNYGATAVAAVNNATGGAGGAKGTVTLNVTAGDVYYIYTSGNSLPANRGSKVIVSYNA